MKTSRPLNISNNYYMLEHFWWCPTVFTQALPHFFSCDQTSMHLDFFSLRELNPYYHWCHVVFYVHLGDLPGSYLRMMWPRVLWTAGHFDIVSLGLGECADDICLFTSLRFSSSLHPCSRLLEISWVDVLHRCHGRLQQETRWEESQDLDWSREVEEKPLPSEPDLESEARKNRRANPKPSMACHYCRATKGYSQ